MHMSMPILAQHLEQRTPPSTDGFCGLERGLYATDHPVRRSPPHVSTASPAAQPRDPGAMRSVRAGVPIPPMPTVRGHAQGVPTPIADEPRGVIPVFATYRIIEDPRA